LAHHIPIGAPVLHPDRQSSCIYWSDKGPRNEVLPPHVWWQNAEKALSQAPGLEAAKVAHELPARHGNSQNTLGTMDARDWV
jgi:hypothetical protein